MLILLRITDRSHSNNRQICQCFSVLSLLRTTSRNDRNNRQLRCFSVLSLWPQCTLVRLFAFYKNRGMTVNGKTGCVASKSRAVIRHSLAASCSFCSSNTTPNKCLKESTNYLQTPKRACKPNLQIAIMHARLVCSQRSFGIPLRMNGKQRLDLLTLEIWSRAFWLPITWNLHSCSKIDLLLVG